MKYYLIAGEASGDMHGSNLMRELMITDTEAQFRFWGGDRMAELGGKLVVHIKDLSFMGFWEVLMNIRTILGYLKFCETDLLQFKPDVLILIDYPGFNLRMAEFARKNNIRVVYYISPQIWAWKQSRITKIKENVDKMLVILPFEKEFYGKFGVEVEFVGHPLLDSIDKYRSSSASQSFLQTSGLSGKPIVALLPGSRKQEICSNLKTMADLAKDFPDYQFVVAAVNEHTECFYYKHLGQTNIKLVYGQTYHLLAVSEAAIVASGTATLETALFEVPQVVCYKASPISYFIARKLVKVRFISLVNLILNRPLVVELIQAKFNSRHLRSELFEILSNPDYRQQMIDGYGELIHLLGSKGASRNAANVIKDFLS